MATLIAVISDTHWSRPEDYDVRLDECVRGADLIVHAGDAVELFVLERLASLAPLKAVSGNCCRLNLRQRWPNFCEFEVEGVRFALFHGHQDDVYIPEDLAANYQGRADVLIHGHTHLAYAEQHDGVWVFNPGSVSEPRGQRGPTFGRIHVEQGQVRLEHLPFPSQL